MVRLNRVSRGHQEGLTLLEIIIVMAMLSILMAIGVNGYRAYSQRLQLNEAAQNTASFIRDVSQKSLTQSNQFKITSAANSGTLTWKDSSNAVVKNLVLPYGKLTAWPEDLVFLSRGLPLKQYKITLNHEGRTRDLYVLTTGKVIVR